MADIRHALQITATPDAVYDLAATAKGFAQWWATDITEPDGSVELAFFNRSTIYRLRLKSDQRPSHAEWICETGREWAGTHIVFDLEPTAQGILLHFAHDAWEAETPYFISCNTTWGELMFRLKAAAEGKPRGPLFLANGLAS